ncbi:MAG: hypothetical protein HC936_16865 [Leptolyngbyaceae cyanobacterium SU_3_3]|nr:hypothetical protein [Leptolyngbyaceae cyanobacterium SU_3_3]NJR49512.1 hypothetical protein [Leptolyngbyaceae cyanobacterium CSU_1_3]
MNHSQYQSALGQVVQISRSDRWQASHRLQELSIPCYQTEDGCLRVDASNLVEILLVRSVIQQLTVPRQSLADWLDRCWSV